MIQRARLALESHPAFKAWRETGNEGELRCEMGWPEASDRRADLTTFFVHVGISECAQPIAR